jgi:carbon-monoxide dehydrogenase small subunit
MNISLTVNGAAQVWTAEPGESLLDLLRRNGFLSVKKGCGSGDCGACAVLLDGRAVNSCLVLAAKVEGRDVVTLEGLSKGERLHPVQEALLDEGAVQCGYCTPGVVISAIDLLQGNPEPTEEQIREAISGNLCRCTGYEKQVRAIEKAASRMRGEGK